MCRTEQEMMLEYWNQLSEEEQRKALQRRCIDGSLNHSLLIFVPSILRIFLSPNKNTPLREMWIRANQDVLGSPRRKWK